jgi:predicted PurR-regulated permease PerM
MTTQQQFRFWSIALLVTVLLLFLLRDVLLPFVAGMAIAYFLDPIADRLEDWGAPRWLGATLVLLSFVVVLMAALVLLVPLLQSQIAQLIDTLPRFIAWLHDRVLPLIERAMTRLSPEDVTRLRNAASQYAGEVVSWLGQVLRGIVSGGFALIDLLTILFITPVVAFYLLRDWDRMVATIDGWLPKQHQATVREQAVEIDRTLAGFVRGQASVCLTLGVFYGVALTVVGLSFGLVVGLMAGLLSFIPYVGSLTGFVASVGIAFFQYDSWTMVAVVAGIFLVGQAVEGNVLTPKLVGDRIGLHPVWVMFALLAGGSLFGFLGVLLAVPVAAAIGVLIRFALGRYLDSAYYLGRSRRGAECGDRVDERRVEERRVDES